MGTRAEIPELLRREVSALRAREPRRVFDATLYVGDLDGERDSFVIRARDLPAIDRAVRVDVAHALVTRMGGDVRWAWLARPGRPDLLDTDTDWRNAVAAGFAMHGRTLHGFWAVTPLGWRDVR